MEFPKFDFKNIDWLSPKPSKERVVVGVAVLALVAGGYALGSRHGGQAGPQGQAGPGGYAQLQPGREQAAGGPGGFQTAGPGPVPLVPLQGGPCRSFAPAGWRVIDQNQDGTVFTASSPDGALIGAYAGLAVGSGQVQGYYGPQYRTPETFALYAISALTHEQAQPEGQPQQIGAYEALPFASQSHRGYVLMYRFPVPDPGGYGVIMRIAVGQASDPRSIGVAGSVAAATRCSVQLHPPPPSPDLPSSGADHGTGKSDGDDSTMAGTYNAQLGTGWVHDAAGNNYNVSVTDDWSNGPEGEGYYKQVGNDRIKLTPGLS